MSGAGAWPVLCAGAWTSFEQGLTALHRQLLRLRGEAAQHCTRDEVFTACDASDPFDLLCLERLRFLSRLLRTGPDAVWALLQNSPDALSAFHSACDWFHCAVRNTSGLACFRTAWTDWVQIMTSSPRRWKGLLKRAAAWHRYRRALRVRWSAFVRSSWQTRPVPAYDPSGLLHGICLQAIEDGLPSLLPVLSCKEGHIQARATAGRGTSHLLAARDEIVAPLLSKLRALHAGDDEAIFAIIREFVEPFPNLRRTLAHWTSELSAGPLRDAAEDVLLCFQVDLLCDGALQPGVCRHATLDPLLVPLAWCPRPAGLPGLVCGASASRGSTLLDISPGGGWRCFEFHHPPPPGLSFAGALIVIPGPPVMASPTWEPYQVLHLGLCPASTCTAEVSATSTPGRYLALLGRLTNATLGAAIQNNSRFGIYAPSRFDHTGDLLQDLAGTARSISGVSFKDAFGRWLAGLPTYVVAPSCSGLPCPKEEQVGAASLVV
ncbi:hypothetical protein AK812_SmicGene17736 [Symbiodinium microadriaticum]|uniref:Uncharacterized protein n=1 Tax=Symbiodinium microadriaticum TaxID=2951 RepID=A0A1Q9DWW9_SYMMI|nr:hypothetical protein AK812_SmicGene17736 [Symbiodinium microadriaticum]